ncbi:hypothetical protein SDRG_03606 [Saprolegnia diclina VS20]|uniref:Uncharacterized protein n=1 Tax=Saprolegnia diclina (strain VS20) TaxID=1156394 RepID=T0QMT9_SAPDV|nr:hypothetical protein SDRG_03606 [Saprolegnia diclina VS20]EQC39404.1 hypothetical protein SDRG_03606 [Saprolegnia diclina VS20]|eukprot:XP_008607465.1 hypothetical protein SDRG_03606 [Saprolegnia diclina VS20]
MADDGYNPEKSRIAEDTLADFLRAPLTGVLTEVPGIGPAAAKKLAGGDDVADQVTNTFQLIGKFLQLKRNDDETDEPIDCPTHCDAFWHWLKSKGVSSYRSGIVMAIAEKVNTMVPGVYDACDFN